MDEAVGMLKDHTGKHARTASIIDQMNMTVLRQLKNSDNERELLEWRVERLQDIDRMKAVNARNAFMSTDGKTLLPSLDMVVSQTNASYGVNTPGPIDSID